MEYSPRKMMELMATKDFERTFLGNPTPVVMKQELFSLANSFKPQTMTEKEIDVWLKKLVSLYIQMKVRHCDDLIKDVETVLIYSVMNEFDKIPNVKTSLENIIFHNEWESCKCTKNKL